MSDTQGHLYQAHHNENLAADLLSKLIYKDWLITTSFYSAIHYVEAKLATRTPPIHPLKDVPRDSSGRAYVSPHQFREDLVHRHYKSIFKEYRMLKEKSEQARYQCVLDTITEKLTKDCFLIYLKRIKNELGLN